MFAVDPRALDDLPDNDDQVPASAQTDSLESPAVNVSRPSESINKPTWDSATILAGQREALIHHNGQFYRLVLTRSGKLILQK